MDRETYATRFADSLADYFSIHFANIIESVVEKKEDSNTNQAVNFPLMKEERAKYIMLQNFTALQCMEKSVMIQAMNNFNPIVVKVNKENTNG